jgi:hypothetical protein
MEEEFSEKSRPEPRRQGRVSPIRARQAMMSARAAAIKSQGRAKRRSLGPVPYIVLDKAKKGETAAVRATA